MKFSISIFALLACLSLQACTATTPQSPASETVAEETPKPVPDAKVSRIYDDPEKDAQIAISLGDYRLLAFSNRTQNVVGLMPEHSLRYLKETCGVRAMPGSGDILNKGVGADYRKLLKHYAKTYNQRVFLACEAKQKRK